VAGDPHVVELVPAANIAAGELAYGLAELWPGSTGVRLSERDDPAAVAAAANGRPVVLVLRDAARHPWQRDVAALLPEATVIETGLPGFPAALETHGAGRANLEAAVAVLSTAG
jgi:beta-N-acetylhexosaminidase